MLRCVDPAGNNGHNILSTEVVFNRFIIGEEKACNTVRVQVNILCSMVGITERSFFLSSQPPTTPPPPPLLRYLHAPPSLTLTNFESWTQTGPTFKKQKLEYTNETALWQRVSSFKVMLY